MDRDEHRDRLIATLLEEVVGQEEPPDVADAVVARAAPPGRRWLRRARAAVVVVAAAAVVAWVWLAARTGYPPPEAAGDFQVVGGGPPRRGATVRAGEDYATLRLGGYCRVDLDPASVVRIEGAQGVEQVFLEQGRIVCDVEAGRGGFAVATEVATATALGTHFSVQTLPPESGEQGMKRIAVHVIAGVVLLAGTWGEQTLRAGEEAEAPPRRREGERRPAAETRVPEGLVGFRGYLIGNLVSTGARGCRLEVASVRPLEGSKAAKPESLVGQRVPLLYLAFRGRDGRYHPSEDLIRAVRKARKSGRLCTVRVRTDGREAFLLDRIWPGAQLHPERPDPDRPREGREDDDGDRDRERDRPREGDRDREGERERRRDRDRDPDAEGRRREGREGDRPRRDDDADDDDDDDDDADDDDDDDDDEDEDDREEGRRREGEGRRGRERDRRREGDRGTDF